MKRVTASEARRNWFRILDEVVGGEEVVVHRNGVRVVIRRAGGDVAGQEPGLPDYEGLLAVSDLDGMDRWRWTWNADRGELEPAVDEDPAEGGSGPVEDGDGRSADVRDR